MRFLIQSPSPDWIRRKNLPPRSPRLGGELHLERGGCSSKIPMKSTQLPWNSTRFGQQCSKTNTGNLSIEEVSTMEHGSEPNDVRREFEKAKGKDREPNCPYCDKPLEISQVQCESIGWDLSFHYSYFSKQTICSSLFLDFIEGGSSGYPNGVMATARTRSGTFRILLTSPSLKAPIQHVPRPSS